MFPKTKNMETSFRAIRLLSLVAVVASAGAGVCFFLMATRVMLKASCRYAIVLSAYHFSLILTVFKVAE